MRLRGEVLTSTRKIDYHPGMQQLSGPEVRMVEDFRDLSPWRGFTSGLAQLQLSPASQGDDVAMELDFDFCGGGGFVVARRELKLSLPEAFTLTFDVWGAAPDNRFEIKLVDASGQNVWWRHWDVFHFADSLQTVTLPSRDISFAWGPAGGGSPKEIAVIEIAVVAGPGGRGKVAIGPIRLQDDSYYGHPAVTASSAGAGAEPSHVLEPGEETFWRSGPGDQAWLELDFERRRALGGAVVHWLRGAAPTNFRVSSSDDGTAWREVRHVVNYDGARSYVYLPGYASRYLRLDLGKSDADTGLGIYSIEIVSQEWARSLATFIEQVARRERRGIFPKYWLGEQTYWTTVGAGKGGAQALFNEEGAVEIDQAGCSLIPTLVCDDVMLTWADAPIEQSLVDGDLPLPVAQWQSQEWALRVDACVTSTPEGECLQVRYQVSNRLERARKVRLFVAAQPFQVDPPWQAFRKFGGISPIHHLGFSSDILWVNREKAIFPRQKPTGYLVSSFDQGGLAPLMKSAAPQTAPQVSDAMGLGEGAWYWDWELPAKGDAEVIVAAPMGILDPSASERWLAQLSEKTEANAPFAMARDEWRHRLDQVQVKLPDAALPFVKTCKTCVAHILINRSGAALEPGPRRYTRSWIRDGAIMGAALLRMGVTQEPIDFVRWYAQFQREDGFVPCCVDSEGVDWLVEHDSHGQLIYAVMECYRFTQERGFIEGLWPAVRKATTFLDALRKERLTAEYDEEDKLACRGLLPESASHEGYLAHPVHSYWDDFWAIRGFHDAAGIAEVLGHAEDASRWRDSEAEMRGAVRESMALTIKTRKLSYVPGSVEWADFDPTATANAIGLLGEADLVPQGPLERSFEQYFEGWRKKREGEMDWANYTAYEVRIVGALVRLGERERAGQLAEFFLSDRRPPPWNQWPEISWKNPHSPGHLGDLPHTWISAEYVIAFRMMFVYEEESTAALVIAAGVQDSWLDGEGISVDSMPTYYGALSYTLRRIDSHRLLLDLQSPRNIPGGLIIKPPLMGSLKSVIAQNSANVRFSEGSISLPGGSHHVTMEYDPGAVLARSL